MRRLSDDELLALLDDLESDCVERKESLRGDVPQKARQAICAFANDLSGNNRPGILLIGAKDNGDPSGVDMTDQMLLTLADMKTDGKILPFDIYPIPTVLGILTLGKSPQDYLPGAYIQFLRIDGTELTDPVMDAEEMRGTLVDVLRRTEEKLRSHNRTAMDVVSSATHRISMPYPTVALQQILYNAVLHRSYENTNAPIRIYWYQNRIEMISPGGPYGNVTAQNFGKPGITDYRNPNIADALKIYGFIQAFGRGIALARQALEKNGNPPLGFEVNESAVVSIMYATEAS